MEKTHMNETEKIEDLEKRLSLIENWTKYAFNRHFKEFAETGEVKEFRYPTTEKQS